MTPRIAVTVVGFAQAREALDLAKAVDLLNRGGASLVLNFVGADPTFKQEIVGVLGGSVVFAGLLPHDKAVAEIAKADVLVGLLSYPRSRQFNLTSKMFEYVAMPVPVILINPTRPDKRMFSQLSGVTFLRLPTMGDIARELESALRMNSNELIIRANNIRRDWGRRSRTRRLASVLDDLCVEAASSLVAKHLESVAGR
jgi:hypothetical protein